MGVPERKLAVMYSYDSIWSASKLVLFIHVLGLASTYMLFKWGGPLCLENTVHTSTLELINVFFKMSFK